METTTKGGGPSKTHRSIREILFSGLFPVGENKKPVNPRRLSWKYDFKKPSKEILRIGKAYLGLVGIDLGACCWVVIDIDLYSPAYQASPEAQAFAARILAATPFKYKTKNGGWHCWFRQPEGGIGCGEPFPGIDQKGSGGYVVCWGLEDFRSLGDFETLAEFSAALPVFDKSLLKKEKKTRGRKKQAEDWTPGGRNNTLNRLAFKIFMRGGGDAEIAALRKKALESDLEDREILATINSAEKAAQREKEKIGATDYQSSDDEAQDFINRMSSLGYEMRDNILSFKCEIKKPGSDKWIELDDKDEDYLFLKIKDIGKQNLRKGDFKIRKNAALSLLKVNPFLLFLKGLPEWDHSNRLNTLFENLFEIPDKDQLPLARAAGFNLFGGIVRRNLYPGCDHDEVLTIYAPQGTGKSSLLMGVVPSPDMFSDSISFLDGYKSFTESLEGKILCEWAEMVGARRSDVGRMKNWISKRKDDVRKAYRRNQRGYDRQCLFVATIDEKIALPDDRNRRFVLFELGKKFPVGKMLQTLKEQPLPQLWAEALHRIKAGESPRLHKSLWAASAKAAEKHRAVDEVFEAAFLKEILARTQEDSPTIEYKGEEYHWFFMLDVLNPLCHTKDERRIIKEPSKYYQREGGKVAGREDVGFERINKRLDGVDTRIWIRPIHWSRPECP